MDWNLRRGCPHDARLPSSSLPCSFKKLSPAVRRLEGTLIRCHGGLYWNFYGGSRRWAPYLSPTERCKATLERCATGMNGFSWGHLLPNKTMTTQFAGNYWKAAETGNEAKTHPRNNVAPK